MPKAPKTAGVSQRAAAAELPVTWPPCQSSYVNHTGSIKLHSKKPQEYQMNVLIFVAGDGAVQLLLCVCVPFLMLKEKRKSTEERRCLVPA